MTGAYLQVKRGDKWEPIEIEHLTKEERHERFIGRTPEALVEWLEMLCRVVRANEKLIEDYEKIIKGLVANGILINKPSQETKQTGDE